MWKMQFKNLSIIIVSFLLVGSCTFLFLVEESNADRTEIYVDSSFHGFSDGSAEQPYNSIKEAIDLAEDGDTIYVFGGLYDEALVIEKKIKLWGSIENGPSIIDYSEDLRYTVEINADYAEIQNFDIRDSERIKTSPIGALICIKSNNVVLQGNNISNSNSSGIYLAPGSNGNVISGNKVNSVENGIYVSSSITNDIFNNIIYNCSEKAIFIESSQSNRFYGNIINNNMFGLYAKDCSNINITNNTINTSHYQGIYLDQINDGIIKNNFINNSIQDALFIKSNDVNIQNNLFDDNQKAITLSGANCNIINNTISNSSSSGIYTDFQSNNNLIYQNHFIDNNPSAKEYGNNYWYYMGQGNYWDDYNYVDRNFDGIGDIYYTDNGVMDIYPLGYFLKPPKKPSNPDPKDTDTGTTLKITLKVDIEDPDSDLLTVSFYRADTNKLIEGPLQNPVKKVESGSRVLYSFTQPFNATVAWYVIVNDSLLENRSDIWFFMTRTAPPNNKPPVANTGGPYSAEAYEPLLFDASSCKDPDGNISFYRWNFGDGSSQILEENPIHIYRNPGTYTATLTIIDNNGSVAVANTTIKISSNTNKKPTANISIPSNGYSGSEILFSSAGSSDPDGDILTHYWSFGDETNSTEENPTHIYQSTGTYFVTLKVSDSQYSDIVSSTITINKAAEETPGFELISILLVLFVILLIKPNKKY